MFSNDVSVLVVDDEELNLDLITEYLVELDVHVVCASSGEDALSVLDEAATEFSTVLLDRMMPGIDGLEVLKRIKANESISRVPVIMQTAKTGKENMLEGLNAGAHYYLSKPYDQETLLAIVSTAIKDYQHYLQLQAGLKETSQTLMMMSSGSFRFQTLEDGRKLATLLAKACPDSEKIVIGLTELITNAIEHGNLGITYEEKSRLNADGEWETEISNRLAMTDYKDKFATVDFKRDDDSITFVITDQGEGFDWQQYMEMCPERAFDSHGRGIALANSVSFDRIEFQQHGKRVCVTVPLQ